MASHEKTKCGKCGRWVYFFRALTGGKRYGECGCERTWILDGAGARFVEHTEPKLHDADCSCHYSRLPEHATAVAP